LIPKGTVESLLEPANLKNTRYINHHVVAGKIDSKTVVAAIKAGKGSSFDNCSRRKHLPHL
jgi:uncharacterized surface protein with fasciclin (FAS1) repeats